MGKFTVSKRFEIVSNSGRVATVSAICEICGDKSYGLVLNTIYPSSRRASIRGFTAYSNLNLEDTMVFIPVMGALVSGSEQFVEM